VRCPYCGHDQDVPRHRLTQLSRYLRSAGDLAARIEGERKQRAQWESWYGPDGRARAVAWLPAVVLGATTVLLWAAGMGLRHANIIGETAVGWVTSVLFYGVFFVVMGAFFARAYARRGSAAPMPLVGATCPRCGASLAFHAGRATERCGHCGTPLIAGTAIIQQAIDVARTDLRREAMARYRVERSAMARVYGMSAVAWVPFFAVGPICLITSIGAIAATVDALGGEAHAASVRAVAAFWLLALGSGGAIVFIVQRRRARRRRWRAIADATAMPLAGAVRLTAVDWVAWLNALWAGPYAVTNLLPGPCFHAVTGTIGPFAVAVDLDPVPADSQHGTPRVDILLAARLPGDADQVAAFPDVAHRTAALGFSLSSCAGGLVAVGNAGVRGVTKTGPAAAAHTLVSVARLLVEWATRVGAVPAAPIPEGTDSQTTHGGG
jgi:hypothetical protein